MVWLAGYCRDIDGERESESTIFKGIHAFAFSVLNDGEKKSDSG